MDGDYEMIMLTRNFFWLLFGSALLMHSFRAWGDVNDFVCGSLQNAYGPFDYRSDKSKLPIVEMVHLTPDVLNLVRGKTGAIGGDLDYTLRAFPNHPHALMSMIRLGERSKSQHPAGAHYSVECYLQRAIRFRADDVMVKLIYATYLAKNGKSSAALDQLNAAVDLGEVNANLHYNIGLVYFDLKQFGKALEHAHVAYNLGFPLPGLRDKLKRAGKWQDVLPNKPEETQKADFREEVDGSK